MRSATDRFRILELHVFPPLGNQPIKDIERADVSELLESLRDNRGLTAQVNRVHTALSAVFSWALDAGLIASHPMVRMARKVAEDERSTLLNLDQLVTVWNEAGRVSSIGGNITRLLILLACRREEVTAVQWRELNLPAGELHLPAQRTKGKRARVVPLPPGAIEIIERQPRSRNGGYVFSANNGRAPFRGWKRAASMLRQEAALMDETGRPLTWHIHDIRRSVATLMGGDPLRVPEETVARILAHSDRTRRGMTARYDHNPRLGQVRDALNAWADFFLAAVSAGGSNVVELRSAER